MSDQHWQNAVLDELGVSQYGLVATESERQSSVATAPRPDDRVAAEHDAEATSTAQAPPPDARPEPRQNGAKGLGRGPSGPAGPQVLGDPAPTPPLTPLPPAPEPPAWQQPPPESPAPPSWDQPAVAWDQPAAPAPAPQSWEQPQPEAWEQAPPLRPVMPEPEAWDSGLHQGAGQPGYEADAWGQAAQSSPPHSEPQQGPAPQPWQQDSGPQPWQQGSGPQPWQQGSGPQAWQQGSGPQAYPGAAPQWPERAAQAPPGYGPSPAADDLVRKLKHGDPIIRRVGRGMRRAVGASAAHEARESWSAAGFLQQPVSTCRRIAVVSIRGGAGKSTMSALVATMIAQHRQDRVLAVDADPGLGSLPLRLGVRGHATLRELAATHPNSWDQMARYLARTGDGLFVLPGTAEGQVAGDELDLETFRAAAGAMTRYFAACVIDCGAGMLAELQRGILADAHAELLVTPGTVDGALSARGALDWLAGHGYARLIPRTVVALVSHASHTDADLERAAQLLSTGGTAVVRIPYDRHLAAGTSIDPSLIGEATREAAVRVAAEVFARASNG